MGSKLRRPAATVKCRSPLRRRPSFAICALLFPLLLSPIVVAHPTPGGATEAGRLHTDLARIAKLANRGLRPPAQSLARGLPGIGESLDRLREPAGAAQAQVGIALAELRQMNAVTTLDPHYMPALVAAGRAYVAVSGQDPLTRTAINPDYRGLETELADNTTWLAGSATRAGKLSQRVKRLTRSLIRAKRRARKLERRIGRMRAAEAPPGRR